MNEPKKPRVLIDPGHGGTDPGAFHGGIREADLNLDIGRRLAMILGAPMTRRTDMNVALIDRVEREHKSRPDAFVSIHCDAGPSEAQGFTVYHNPGSVHGRALAGEVEAAMRERLAEFARRSRGVRSTDNPATSEIEHFYVLKNTGAPAVLVECGFLSNQFERDWLSQLIEHRQALAEGIARGVLAWFTTV